jgi:hypothetical protein
MERMTDPSRFAGLDENDPKSMARAMKSMTQEMGEDLGEDFDVDAMMDEAMSESDAGGTGGPDSDSGCGDD